MEHLAILSKTNNLLSKILSGEKTIESRWYKHKKAPFGTLSKGDIIYFKESGAQVTARASVKDFEVYENLSPDEIKSILSRYSAQLGVDISYYDNIKDKTLCMLIFLQDVEKIPPFNVKKSYGTAWISLDSINKLRI
ncbi:MAG: hypothetical protein Q8L29_04025 [archaeon]|nr:hypothetical protein [archaeon]